MKLGAQGVNNKTDWAEGEGQIAWAKENQFLASDPDQRAWIWRCTVRTVGKLALEQGDL
jgi:hypothetical protein